MYGTVMILTTMSSRTVRSARIHRASPNALTPRKHLQHVQCFQKNRRLHLLEQPSPLPPKSPRRASHFGAMVKLRRVQG